MSLAHVAVVLVRPRQPGNVGLVARAIANHGLGPLHLVDPPAYDPFVARTMAPHSAHVLDAARFFADVPAAVAHAERVLAASGRPGRISRTVLGPQAAARLVLDDPRPTAILFGPEDSGLSTADLDAAGAVLTLPTEGHDSLNLAAAVTAVASHLRAEAATRAAPAPRPPARAPAALLDAALADATALLHASGYTAGHSPDEARAALRTLAERIGTSAADLALLRGMMKGLKAALRRDAGPAPSQG